MTLFAIAASVGLLFAAAYRWYGRFLARAFGLDDARPTPAATINDGVDYVPTRPAILLGQHFAAIAAVGPIVGPILAGMHYGWAPGLVWVALGAIFIGHGMMKFGSRLDMYFPKADIAVTAKEGDTVTAGETVVARIGQGGRG